MHKNKRIVWLFDKAHIKQPFIVLALATLCNEGCDVSVIDTSIVEGKETKIDYNYVHYPLFNKRSFLVRAMLMIHGSRRFVYSVPKMLAKIKRLKPQIIICTGPGCLLIGWLFSKLSGLKLIYYPFELYGEQHSNYSKISLVIEKIILGSGVDALITQNHYRAKVYVNERNAALVPTIVHNYKPKNTNICSEHLRKMLNIKKETTIILYQGHLIKGRYIENLFVAFSNLNIDAIMVLMSKKNRYYQDKILPLIKKLGIKDKVIVLPWVKSEKVAFYCAGADVGIIIYDDRSRNNFYCEPGKLSDYIAAGIPIIAPNFPTIAPVINKHKIGCLFDPSSSESITKAIIDIVKVKKQVWNEYLEKAQKHLVWETQEPALLRAVLGKNCSNND